MGTTSISRDITNPTEQDKERLKSLANEIYERHISRMCHVYEMELRRKRYGH